jgi:hypothetical protein
MRLRSAPRSQKRRSGAHTQGRRPLPSRFMAPGARYARFAASIGLGSDGHQLAYASGPRLQTAAPAYWAFCEEPSGSAVGSDEFCSGSNMATCSPTGLDMPFLTDSRIVRP